MQGDPAHRSSTTRLKAKVRAKIQAQEKIQTRDRPPVRLLTLVSLLTIGFLGLCSAATALDPSLAITQYSLSVWTTDEGLPQNTVRDMAQTPDGFLWFGTQAGLVRFDGVQFRVFDSRSDLEIDNHHIYALDVDTQGNLWIGTNGGGLLRRIKGRFEPLPTEVIPSGRITALEAGSDGTMWIGTYGDGLVHYERLEDDERQDAAQRFTVLKRPDGLAHEVIFDLALEPSGNGLWIATYGGGVQRLEGDRFHTYDTDNGLADNGTWAVQPSADGSVWFGSNGGLHRLLDGNIEIFTRSEGLPHDRVISLAEDLDGNLWIGTYGGGLCRRRPDGTLDHLRQTQGLAGNIVWSLFEDRDGSIWAGSLGKGLTQLNLGAFTTFGVEEGLSSNITSSLYLDKRGDLWIATRGAGLNILRQNDPASFPFEPFGRPQGLTSDGIWALHEDVDGNFWFATNGAGVQRLDPTGQWTRFTPQDGLADNVVFGLLEDSRGDMWFATNGGLSRFREGGIETFAVEDGLPTNQIRALKEDVSGDLWIGTTGGLCSLKAGSLKTGSLKTGSLKTRYPETNRPEARQSETSHPEAGGFETSPLHRDLLGEGILSCFSTADGLSSNNIWAIHQDNENILWLGTAGGGLVRFDGTSFFPLTSRQGLYDDEITVVLEDQEGYFWLGASRGVFRVKRQEVEDYIAGRASELSYVTYGRREGIKDSAGHTSGMQTDDGRIWIAHLGGYSVVDPKDLFVNKAPRVIIESVRANGQSLSEDAAPLPPSSRDFEFYFTAPTLTLPERVSFRYRLRGFEETWKVAQRREAMYSFLQSGDYLFEVMASDTDGTWNGPVTSFTFRVEAPFYRTSAFFLMAALSVLTIGFLAHEMRVRGLRQREKQLNRRVDESMARLKILRGLLPVCSSCHKVRENDGSWQPIDRYIHEHSEASMSHSVCPDCALELYPDIFEHPDSQ